MDKEKEQQPEQMRNEEVKFSQTASNVMGKNEEFCSKITETLWMR